MYIVDKPRRNFPSICAKTLFLFCMDLKLTINSKIPRIKINDTFYYIFILDDEIKEFTVELDKIEYFIKIFKY